MQLIIDPDRHVTTVDGAKAPNILTKKIYLGQQHHNSIQRLISYNY
jgi:hypothetical protein